MTSPHRVQLSRRKGWRMPANTVSVARPGRWGNPFIVQQYGTPLRVVYLFRRMLQGWVAIESDSPTQLAQFTYRQWVREHVEELRGKNLACWCSLDAPCHADVLLELANRKRGTAA